jgi:plasmid stabilization system protein ParE
MAKVIWSPSALKDIEKIARIISKDSPAAFQELVKGLANSSSTVGGRNA